jgi:hypothetical protein
VIRRQATRTSPYQSGVCATAFLLAAVLLAGAPPASGGPVAAPARVCHAPAYPGLGYFTSLTVFGTSCNTGSKLALSYYHCRTRHGIAGTCHSAVLGYTCHETRRSIPTEIEARVTCRKGGASVIHTYQQDT